MSEYKFYNPNPRGVYVGDCVVRAITKATGWDWCDVYAGVTCFGYMYSDMPSANHVWGAFLRNLGYKRHFIEDYAENPYTVSRFAAENPEGTYILATPGHVVCVVDGDWYDSWNSGDEIPLYYWKREV